MTPKLAKIMVGGLTATVLAAAFGGAALAQVTTPPTGTPAAQVTTPQAVTPTARAKADRGQGADALLGALATNLGKSQDEVRAAVVAAQKQVVDQAVTSGRLTADQATKIKARIDQTGGRGALRAPSLPAKAPRAAAPAAKTDAGLAQFLGVTPQQLGQELKTGQSLAQVAQAHGKSRDQLKQHLTDQVKTRLDRAVADGKLTRERADQMLSKATQGLDKLIDHARKAAQPGQRAPAKASKAASL
jgi:polyhydroxyalkanoate synthesis regulator phasin